ncbi:hypothetical protein PRIPAC_77393 [Pristionchus pacificus]|uniref:Uncharacterized protein n=1 Tax=Pristionchus pacificus TaxID=54126 RepID=A0A2A6BYJ5_PRIPA|nr:hypothetical protein PRIPAC_77393 [Pristionchus pacificus]|eukprot:PDM70948.1 hypothetical protein PRIPAC_44344 [Pristionchus pacificus]
MDTHYEVTTSIVYDISGPRNTHSEIFHIPFGWSLMRKEYHWNELRNRKKRFPAVKNRKGPFSYTFTGNP